MAQQSNFVSQLPLDAFRRCKGEKCVLDDAVVENVMCEFVQLADYGATTECLLTSDSSKLHAPSQASCFFDF